jgi:hypothetical protein
MIFNLAEPYFHVYSKVATSPKEAIHDHPV